MSSSASCSSLCCICQKNVNKSSTPSRIFACLRPACSDCIEKFVPDNEKPLKCPGCKSPIPSSLSSHLLQSVGSSGDLGQDDFSPNHIKCQGCDENDAEEYCKDCNFFFCLACKKPHLRVPVSSHHQFISINEGAKIRTEGAPSSTRVTICETHNRYEVNSYCEKCKEVCCAECAVDNHSGHFLVRLATIAQRFKEEISVLSDKVKPHTLKLPVAINEISLTMTTAGTQAKISEEQISDVFDQLRKLLDDRQAELIGEIEAARHQKEKQLMLQKEELEFLLGELRIAVQFAEDLVANAPGVEIVARHKPVTARFKSLESEMGKAKLSPVVSEMIQFVGGEKGAEDIGTVAKRIGRILVRGMIPAGRSSLKVQVNQDFPFTVAFVDHKGAEMKSTGVFEVKVVGPSKGVKNDRVQDEMVLSELDTPGKHDVSVKYMGKDLEGSPFELLVTEKPRPVQFQGWVPQKGYYH